MEQQDEKFFENLANRNLEDLGNESETKIELAKAGGATASRSKIGTSREQIGAESEPEGQLTIDVYQTPSEIVVESAVAGVNPDDIDINVTNDSITVKGKRHRDKEVKDEDYFYQECYWGKFSRSVILPQEVDAEKTYANFKNGILTVHLPKLNRQRSKKVRVKLE